MTQSEIKEIYLTSCKLLENRQLKEALEKLQSFSHSILVWQLSDKIKDLQENYRLMLNYSFEGVKDPQQNKLYASLIASSYKILEDVNEEILCRDSHDYVFSQKRYFPYTKTITTTELITELESGQTNAGLSELVEQSLNTPGKRKEYAIQNEKLSEQLFKILWLTGHYSDEENNLIKKTLDSEITSLSDKCLAVSALMLSLLRCFNEEKLLILIDCCTHKEDAVSQRALVALLPILAHYDSRLKYFPAVRNRLVVLFDSGLIIQHIKHIILQFARTNETERISKKLQEEILPEMMKVAPKLREKIDLENLMKSDDPDEKNPEWQDILEDSGIADKLKEFSDLQMEGSDVYMSTFSMLKNYPFFQEVCNWFRPFDSNQSDIYELFEGDGKSFLMAMMTNGYMCNSDRYSFCLSLMQMPSSQRDMMRKAFTVESEHIDEMQKEEAILSQTKKAENISNSYIQDLYRFFKLFPHKEDFENPFDYSLEYQKSWFFNLIGFDYEEIRQIGEYYFSKDFYKQALELFEKIENETSKTLDLCQKVGYCYQKLGDFSSALQHYQQAEIILPNQKWTIRKIAYCYRMLKDYENALEYYLRVEEMSPDNLTILTQIGNCFLNNNQYDEALAYYFKVEYVTTNNVKMWRAIAWSSFLAGKLEQATKFLEKAIEEKEDWTDYLNLGHISFVNGNKKEAILNYKKAIELNLNDLGFFLETFNRDSVYLKERGIDEIEISIVLDYLRYLVE